MVNGDTKLFLAPKCVTFFLAKTATPGAAQSRGVGVGSNIDEQQHDRPKIIVCFGTRACCCLRPPSRPPSLGNHETTKLGGPRDVPPRRGQGGASGRAGESRGARRPTLPADVFCFQRSSSPPHGCHQASHIAPPFMRTAVTYALNSVTNSRDIRYDGHIRYSYTLITYTGPMR